MNIDLDKLKYNDAGLIPCITQDYKTKEVLMLAYMNRESIRLTLETKQATYFSRSRQALWVKGATSGHTQRVLNFAYDCDADTILLQVEQTGNACHTGAYSCFFHQVFAEEAVDTTNVLDELYALIEDRRTTPKEGSYTNYLFEKGLNKILKKVGEETTETIIAAKNGDRQELISETSDLVYHMLVLLVHAGVTIDEVKLELAKRHQRKQTNNKNGKTEI